MRPSFLFNLEHLLPLLSSAWKVTMYEEIRQISELDDTFLMIATCCRLVEVVVVEVTAVEVHEE